MKTLIHADNLNLFSPPSSLDINAEIPNKCPLCETAYASAPIISSFFKSDAGIITAYSIFFCPACEKAFFACYDVIDQGINSTAKIGILNALYPSLNIQTHFSPAIENISPSFVKIYNQSEQAENQGLSDICGIGYRKSLEFLIKDYVISHNPSDRSKIESMFLNNCISTYIDNDKIKALAKASTWLGNDEAHYVQKNVNYTVQDLKRFIRTVVAYIEYELTYSEALELISDH